MWCLGCGWGGPGNLELALPRSVGTVWRAVPSESPTRSSWSAPPIVVTRHPALIQLLLERGLVAEDSPVLAHAAPEDLIGRHVYGVLPLHLAVHATIVTEIPLQLTPEDRDVELPLSRLRQIAGEAVTYKVSRVR
jgi:hypothetical protein